MLKYFEMGHNRQNFFGASSQANTFDKIVRFVDHTHTQENELWE